jgi:bifunctional DNA-binding transcriptional regulator/antitoxin component of YhaV-PrlF toxin-antitoxin module
MNRHLTIDRAGRVMIPKPLREKLHLAPGEHATDDMLQQIREERDLANLSKGE